MKPTKQIETALDNYVDVILNKVCNTNECGNTKLIVDDKIKEDIVSEMKISGCQEISCLHITSWDQDHCNHEELKLILQYLKPKKIDHPGYTPDTDCGIKSLQIIKGYCSANTIGRNEISHSFVNSLEPGEELKFNNIIISVH